MAKAPLADNREFCAGPWRVVVTRSHILRSVCERSKEGCSREEEEPCSVCLYARELNLPSLPEMVFPKNGLVLEHQSGASIEFCALDALRLVDPDKESVQVAAAQEWKATREEGLKEVREKVKSYDWTFTTTYKGSVRSPMTAPIKVEPTETCIDYDKLREQEKIYFYDDVLLFEDELADNGIAELRVKIRVMASGFFILLRFFLRVDGVLVRIIDTRFYHQAGSDHILREHSSRELKLSERRLPIQVLQDPSKLAEFLPQKRPAVRDRLVLPPDSSPSQNNSELS